MYATLGSSFRFPSRRLAAALIASALLHLWLGGALHGSSARRAPDGPRIAEIRAALERIPADAAPSDYVPEPAADAVGERAPVSRTARTQTRESQPKIGHGTHAAPREPKATGAHDATYYAARELDVYPAPAHALVIPYPERARGLGVSGHVQAVLLLDAMGRVESVGVVDAQPPGYFESEVRRVFTDARFTPAQRNGRPVKSRLLVQVSFGEQR